ncbi:hypothetical protein COV11_04545 [Candidatus Woesearchaeota archaeon CG10_big_fil_rev_8_21_14_0_10_30_7]|nr:MAG: hypothetical protein COV11_04545 [Candidatus Woesearchaeota archaeon CG10_big_fil_rev_8_21_14_0_10_30_7]
MTEENYLFYHKDLFLWEAKLVHQIVRETIERLHQEAPYSLRRCTFFADNGYKFLEEAVQNTEASNPRIEGCDSNPFDQHYWLAFDLEIGTIIVDPIFNYFGLERNAGDLLPDYKTNYYRRKRKVRPNKSVDEGGVRIKTIGI